MNLPIHLPFAIKNQPNVDNYIMVTISCMDHGSVKACDILFHQSQTPLLCSSAPSFFSEKRLCLASRVVLLFFLALKTRFVAETHETSRIFVGWAYVRLGLASGLDKGPIPFVGIAQPMVLMKGDPRKKSKRTGWRHGENMCVNNGMRLVDVGNMCFFIVCFELQFVKKLSIHVGWFW